MDISISSSDTTGEIDCFFISKYDKVYEKTEELDSSFLSIITDLESFKLMSVTLRLVEQPSLEVQ
jgi:hypothetical protein